MEIVLYFEYFASGDGDRGKVWFFFFLNSEIMRRSISKLLMFIKICIFMNVESKQRFISLLLLVSYIHCYY